MVMWLLYVAVCLQGFVQFSTSDDNLKVADRHWMREPTVMMAVLVRNKAHTLPWFMHYLQNLDYPKQRIRLWIRSDHNEDNSVALINEWLNHVRDDYNDVDFQVDESEIGYPDATGPLHWSNKRFENVLQHRQAALDAARKSWADFLLFVDADNLLINNQVLRELINQDKLIIAPMLNTTITPHYSNFWCGMDSSGYYRRTEDYLPIQKRHREGVFAVPMVHSTVLIQLRDPASRLLGYVPPPPGYSGPVDDIIVFAHAVQRHGLTMHIDNRDFYGFLLAPLDDESSLEQERSEFLHLRLESIVADKLLQKLPYINVSVPVATKLGFDEVYMINLERRPDRREKMSELLRELGISATIVNAVDGKLLNQSYLQSIGVNFLPGYADPFTGRAMTMGEIGCFLSHYMIWQDILSNRYEKVIVFEDDVRFRPFFHERFQFTMYEVAATGLDWDLLYLGRKILRHDLEEWVEGTSTVVWPHYSYWTLSYMLTYRGAWKLVQQNPLGKLLPVDEYLPIMFDKHPQENWKLQFSPRNLVALSAQPVLVEPTHYTGQPGYVTDTEDSPSIDDDVVKKFKGDTGEMAAAKPGISARNTEL